MTIYHRKTDPKVIGGKTLKKNNWARSVSRAFLGPNDIFVERRNPGKGYKHVVSRRQVTAFLNLLPDWGEISQGLRGMILAEGGQGCDGWHRLGTVALCAWEQDLWISVGEVYHTEHKSVLAMLGVESQRRGDEWVLKYTPQQATAFALMHVLLHELGHHHDRMTTRRQASASRGEGYAERYANEYAPMIWERYQDVFGL
jgi:hypothetical protein